jgi:hypothetical protein
VTASTSTDPYERDGVCNIKIHINNFKIVDSLTCGLVNAGIRVGAGVPALLCAYDYDVIGQLLEDRIIETIALREAAEAEHYAFDVLDVNAWQQLKENRPDIVLTANRIQAQSTFLQSFQSEIKTWSDVYMKLVTHATIRGVLSNSFEMLLTHLTDQGMETIRKEVGLKGRNAKARQRAGVNLTRMISHSRGFTSDAEKELNPVRVDSHMKNSFTRFMNLERMFLPSEGEVARYMGYTGLHADDQLRRDLSRRFDLLKSHGHSSHHWKRLVKEILGRDS